MISTPFKNLTVYITRHGETDWNAQNKLQGSVDIPLNDNGKLQAHQLRESFTTIEFDHIFSSDLQRAYQTAEILASDRNVPFSQCPCLREASFGPWEGKFVSELQAWRKERAKEFNLFDHQSYIHHRIHETIETKAEVFKRFGSFISSLPTHLDNKTILVVSHGGVIAGILDCLNFTSGLRWKLQNCAYLKLLCQDDTIAILDKYGAYNVPVDE